MENYKEDEITTHPSADNEGGDSKGRLGEELAIKEISSSGLLELLGGEGKSPKRAGGGSLTWYAKELRLYPEDKTDERSDCIEEIKIQSQKISLRNTVRW